MRRRKPRCPKCRGDMGIIWGRERAVRGGTWRVYACPRCLYVFNHFRPRRTKEER